MLRPRARSAAAAAGAAACLVLAGCSGTGPSAAGREPPSPGASRPAEGPSGLAPASPAARRQPVARHEFTIAATGDVLAHEPVVNAARTTTGGTVRLDFRPLFARVRSELAGADLAICHLETPLSAGSGPVSYWPTFSAPPELAAALAAAGYDTCSTASNHSLDQGVAGVSSTLGALDRAGVRHVGTARSAAEAAAAAIYPVRGYRVGHLSYAFGFNGFHPPAGKSWLANVIDVPRILRDAHAIRAAGAQFVVVSLHWGTEYQAAPTAEQRSIARRLLAGPDIDLILGHHAHVVQPIEARNGKFVVYGMGNFLAKHAPCCNVPATRDGMIVRVVVAETGGRLAVRRLTFTPTWVDQTSMVVLPVARSLADPALPASTRLALQASWRSTVSVVESLGATRAGVVPE